MCGIFGFCGDPNAMNAAVSKLARAKIKILGLYNVSRGKHSCGVFINNEIIKGVDKLKLFEDFIVANEFPDPFNNSNNYVILGHTRQATNGSHIEANAHPHQAGDDFTLVHNGIIRNIWSLCNEHKISHNSIHVDSLGLANLIDKEGFKILEKYEGFAALLMTRVSEPNKMYVYKGASRKTTNGEEEEERPLFYLQSEEGMYFSSLQSSLLAISDGADNEPFGEIESNIVHEIRNGKFTGTKIHIDRSSINSTTNFMKGATTTKDVDTTNSHVGKSYSNSSLLGSRDFLEKTAPLIQYETYPEITKRVTESSVIFYHYGRYWILDREGNIVMAHGSYYINRKGRVLNSKLTHSMSTNNHCNLKRAHIHFFYEGVKMKSERAYVACCEDEQISLPNSNFAYYISKYSEFPVCNTKSDLASRCNDVSEYYKYRWYFNGIQVTNLGFTPRWSKRNYSIKMAFLSDITSLVPKEECIDTVLLQKDRADSVRATNTENVRVKAPVHQLPLSSTFISPPHNNSSDDNISNFYRPWLSIDQIRLNLNHNELNAVRYYISDVMINEMNYTDLDSIFDDRVEVQMSIFFTQVVDAMVSIKDLWDEDVYKNYLHYIDVARKNPSGEIYPPDAPEEDVDDCCITSKPIETKIIDMFAENNKEQKTEDAIVPDSSESTESNDEVVREVNEAREYPFSDSVDHLVIIRGFADEYQAFTEDDFCQDVANVLYKGVDSMLSQLIDLVEKHGEKGFKETIELLNKTKSRL